MCREGKSIIASAKAYGMSNSTLQNRFKMQEEGKTLVGSGRKICILRGAGEAKFSDGARFLRAVQHC